MVAPVRIGVIGAGLIGRKHIEVLMTAHPEYRMAGVADPAPAAAEEAAQKGYPHYAEWEALLEREKPEGIIVAVPNQLHVSIGLACVSRGIAVLVEKPIADSVASAMELVETAEKAGVPTMTGHHRRHNPIMRRAAEIIQAGELGRVVAANALYLSHKHRGYHDLTWRREPGGGPVLINAIHDIDCLRMMCGDIVTVQAAASNAVRGFVVEDTAGAVLTFASGAIGTILTSDTASTPWSWEWGSRENPGFPHKGEPSFFVAGTRGALTVPDLVQRWHEPGHEDWRIPLTERRNHVVPVDSYVNQMTNFARVIRGTEQPAISGREGAMTLATTLAITESARAGRPVHVADMLTRRAG